MKKISLFLILPFIFSLIGASPRLGSVDASKVLEGYTVYDSSGNLITGTLPSFGALNPSAPFVAGYYNGTLTGLPQSTQIEKGTSILGVAGTASPSFSDLIFSHAFRDSCSSTMTLANETALGTCSDGISFTRLACETASSLWTPAAMPSNYRIIPDGSKDNDGYFGPSVNYAPRPTVDCGTSGSIVSRIADCASKNPLSSSWNGSLSANQAQASWSLVSRIGANHEVWKDLRTGFLWSSLVASTSINWCQAAGVTSSAPFTFSQSYHGTSGTPIIGNGNVSALGGGDNAAWENITLAFTSATAITLSASAFPGSTAACTTGGSWTGALTAVAGSSTTYTNPGICSFTITQGSTPFVSGDAIVLASAPGSTSCVPGSAAGLQPVQPISYCAEASGLNPPTGETWAQGGYSASKGGMGANSSTKVLWRLPTRQDYYLADIDGIRFVLPDMGNSGSGRTLVQDASPGCGWGSYVGSEWTATVYSMFRSYSWVYSPSTPWSGEFERGMGLSARCVGR